MGHLIMVVILLVFVTINQPRTITMFCSCLMERLSIVRAMRVEYGIWNEAILTSIPLQSVKLIEVTRGPGSVLYGTNAFAGVVNIITHTPGERDNFIEIGAGSFNHHQINGYASGKFDEWNWSTALRWLETDCWPIANDLEGDPFSGDAWSRSPGFLGSLSKHGFSVSAFWG